MYPIPPTAKPNGFKTLIASPVTAARFFIMTHYKDAPSCPRIAKAFDRESRFYTNLFT